MAVGALEQAANQPPPRPPLDEYEANLPLREAVERHGAGWSDELLHRAGSLAGSEDHRALADLANRNRPSLAPSGDVVYDPAYHAVMRQAIELGAHALPWREPRPGSHVARAALFLLLSQAEPGHGCPVSMTHAAVPALRAEPELAAEWEPLLTSLAYDPELRPVAGKGGALCGMAMTERQGGSDVRANTTRAEQAAEPGWWRLTGHKWFCSAPMSDLFLVLALGSESEGSPPAAGSTLDSDSRGSPPGAGITCFALPRVLPDGTRNGFRIEALKDKLGNHSNASAEIALDAALARRVGVPGRGVQTIIEMVNHTRLDCVLGTAAGMRGAVAEAVWHARHRVAFGRRLLEQPLMRNVLADLCLELEAATALALRLAAAYDDPGEASFRRAATPVAKYWVCKRGPAHAAEALECLGGNGYVETYPLARRYREQPLLSIWEGSGNVVALDVLRAVARNPETLRAVLAEVEHAAGSDRRLDAHVAALHRELGDPDERELRARGLVERLALALQASLLVRHAPAAVSDAFCAGRLGEGRGAAYGTLQRGCRLDAILERHALEPA
jgi:putative acyl-CoA dehydrogenase